MNEALSALRTFVEVLAALAVLLSPLLLAWLKNRIRDELAPLTKRLGILEDAHRITEFQVSQYAPALRDIPRMTVLMEQHEETATRTSSALEMLGRTMHAVSERLARIEEHVKLRDGR